MYRSEHSGTTGSNRPQSTRGWSCPIVGAVLCVALGACGIKSNEPAPNVEQTRRASVVYNALTTNALTHNALTSNALTSNALTSNSLSHNGLTTNAMAFNAMAFNAMAFNAMAFNGITDNAMAFNAMAFNAMAFNAMAFNGIIDNAMAFNAMAFNAMAFNGITDNADKAIFFNALNDDVNFRALVSYAYACALPAEHRYDRTIQLAEDDTLELSGQYGLAPEWADGPCDDACREKVSTCIATFPDPNAGSLSLTDAIKQSTEIRSWLENAYTCAMPETATFELLERDADGNPVLGTDGAPISYGTLTGQYGLAPEWGEPDGQCDEHCRATVQDCARKLTNPLIKALATDEYARHVFSYMYSCAMPEGQNLTLELPGHEELITYKGGIGLAPQWGTEACDESCQRWVSACVLARTNAYGIRVEISLRGAHPALMPDPNDAIAVAAFEAEKAEFALREGAYYGNLFAESPTYNSCAGPASNIPELTKRFCSSRADGCALQTTTHCVDPVDPDQVCPRRFFTDSECATEQLGRAFSIGGPACADFDPVAGALANCSDDDASYHEVVTVYLREPGMDCGNSVCEKGEDETLCPVDCHPGAWLVPLESRNPMQVTSSYSTRRIAKTVDGVVILRASFDDMEIAGVELAAEVDGIPHWGVLAKFSDDGALKWARRIPGASLISAVAVGSDEEIIVTGWNSLPGLELLSDASLTGDYFVQKYDSFGNLVWIFSMESDSLSDVLPAIFDGLAVGPDGSIVFRLRADTSHPFMMPPEYSLHEQTLSAQGTAIGLSTHEHVLVKLSPSGSLEWVKGDAYSHSEHMNTVIRIVEDGSIYHLSGVMEPNGLRFAYAVRRSGDGTVLEAHKARPGQLFAPRAHYFLDDGTLLSVARELAEDDSGDGVHYYNIERRSRAGELEWKTRVRAGDLDVGVNAGVTELNHLTIDEDGNVLVAGYFAYRATVGDVVFTSERAGGIVAKLDGRSGEFRWAKHIPSRYQFPVSELLATRGRILLFGIIGGAAVPAGRLAIDPFSELANTYTPYVASFLDPDSAEDHARPVLRRLPEPIVIESVESTGSAAYYEPPIAADDVDFGLLPVDCTIEPGDVVPLGTHTVSCTATDSSGNTSEPATFTIVVQDTVAPTLELPGALTAAAAGATGTAVSYTVSATDTVDGAITPTCSPASSSLFPQGTTSVNCTATDSSGNTTSGSFLVRIPYSWSGMLEPMESDGSAVFKPNRTVPIKFRLTGTSAGLTDLSPTLSVWPAPVDADGTPLPDAAAAEAAAGCDFRYGASEAQYMCNLKLRSLHGGRWELRINLGDGEVHKVQFSIR